MSKLLADLGAAVFLAPDQLGKLIRSAPRRYKVFRIAKRTPNQMRTIAQPAREVKVLQYWVMEHVLKIIIRSSCGNRVPQGVQYRGQRAATYPWSIPTEARF